MDSFTEYQRQASTFAVYPTEAQVTYPILGLVNEAGEVAGKWKKLIRGDEIPEDFRKRLSDELGDVLWYLAQVATDLALDLDDIAKENLEKLEDRRSRSVIKGSGDNR